jgi:YVTN family beta-propeller protein
VNAARTPVFRLDEVANSAEHHVGHRHGDRYRVITNLDVGSGTTGIAVNAAGTHVYISDQHDGSLWMIDAVNNTAITKVATGNNAVRGEVSNHEWLSRSRHGYCGPLLAEPIPQGERFLISS